MSSFDPFDKPEPELEQLCEAVKRLQVGGGHAARPRQGRAHPPKLTRERNLSHTDAHIINYEHPTPMTLSKAGL